MLTLSDIIIGWLVMEFICLVICCFTGFKFPKDRFFVIPAAAVSAGVQGVVGLAQIGVGIGQKIKAAKLAKSNIRPVLQDDPYIEQAYDLTASQAAQGLTDGTKQMFLTNNDRNLSSSIDAILKSGGSANNIGDLYSSGQSVIGQMALQNQEAQMRNTNNFLNIGLKQKADQERDEFFLNEMVPYQDKAALASELATQGMDNIWKGVGTASGAMGAMNPFAEKTQPGVVKPPREYASTNVSTTSYMPPRPPANVTGAMPMRAAAGIFKAPPNIMQGYNTNPTLGQSWKPLTQFNYVTGQWE